MSDSVTVLLSELYVHDSSTHDHCRSVGAWSGLLAKSLRSSAEDVRFAMLAGTLHDVGKSQTPLTVLLKAGPLTPDEWDVMRRHAADGAATLEAIPLLRSVAPVVRSHHERIDGRGYPDGLAGNRIPLLARIVAVSDSFHAMITSRPYRQAVSVAEALDLLRFGRGTQWEPVVVDAMIELVAAKTQRAKMTELPAAHG